MKKISLRLLAAVLLCALFFANPFGSGAWTGLGDVLLARTDGVVIGLGTLLLAILTGLCMKLTDPLVDRIFGHAVEG